MNTTLIHLIKVRDDLEYFYCQTCDGTQQEFEEIFRLLMTDRKLKGYPRTTPFRLVIHAAIVISNRIKCLRASEEQKATLRPALMSRREIDRDLLRNKKAYSRHLSRRLFKMLNTNYIYKEIVN